MIQTTKKYISKSLLGLAAPLMLTAAFAGFAQAQDSPKEEDYFKINKVTSPEGTLLEVGGLCTLPNGDLAISTRRGDVFIAENPTSATPYFRKFASGLHELLGVAYKDGALYVAQRGELTKLKDTNMDGKADVFETIYAWPISGHYHEYSFGPKIAPDGSFFVTGNVAFGDEEWWRGESRVPMRGWTMHIYEDGRMEPWATGMRSPCGISMIDGELFYTDNQGDWMGSGAVYQVPKGAFIAHPAGLRWTGLPNSPVKLTMENFLSKIDERKTKDANGRYIKPENRVNEKFTTLFEMKKQFPEMQLPAVWLPYGILGISNSEIVKIPAGSFGPFEGQLLVGDQGQSIISRVFTEKVNGVLQGASFSFRKGFQSGVLRMSWAQDGSLFVGETNRGWGSAGEANAGLQRLTYDNSKMPFEMKAVRAMADGFEVEFTSPVDRKTAEDLASYSVESFLYKYHPVYGSPPINVEKCKVKGVKVSDDGLRARLIVDNLRQYYIHTLALEGIHDKAKSNPLVHPIAYYTLNSIPTGEKLSMSEVSTKNTGGATAANKAALNAVTKTGTKAVNKKAPEAKTNVTGKAPTYDEVKGLLTKHTCLACHNANKRQVGPAYVDVSKRGYTNEEIVSLIYNPKPQHWPDYPTEMPPMPQVPKPDALKIAAWINSLAPASAKVRVKDSNQP